MKIFLILFCVISFSVICHGIVQRKYFNTNGDNYFVQNFDSTFFNNWPTNDRPLEGIGELTMSLLHNIYSRAGKGFNIVLSPVSVWVVLAMLLEGAAGKTEKELKSKLHLFYGPHEEGKNIVRSRYYELRQDFQREKIPTSFISLNFVISDNMKEINPEYKNIIREFYQGMSFQINPKERGWYSTLINKWAKEASKNQIQTIVSPAMLNNLVLMIGNAVYFKSKWKHPFDPRQTTLVPFKDDNGKPIKHVLMMNQILMLPYSYSSFLESQIVEIPYNDNATSMIVILPHDGVSLNSVLSKMTYLSLDQIIPKNMTEEFIQLSIPKFHIISKMYLNEVLKQDLPSAFSYESAEFPGIGKDTYVSKVSHKGEIENNEEGTTAFAVTSVQFAYKSSGVMFQANRPFIYLITQVKTRNILFAGTFSNPFTLLP